MIKYFSTEANFFFGWGKGLCGRGDCEWQNADLGSLLFPPSFALSPSKGMSCIILHEFLCYAKMLMCDVFENCFMEEICVSVLPRYY